MLLLLLERGHLIQPIDDAIDARPRVTLSGELSEQLGVLPLAFTDDGCQHLEASAFLQLQHLINDLLRCLPTDDRPTDRAMRLADPRIEQT